MGSKLLTLTKKKQFLKSNFDCLSDHQEIDIEIASNINIKQNYFESIFIVTITLYRIGVKIQVYTKTMR